MNLRDIRRLLFKFKYIKGKNNRVVAIKDGKEYNILMLSKHFNIEGNNNQIIFNCDNIKKVERNMPKGLKISISGNNNFISIEYPLKITDTCISMTNDNNSFEIKSSKHKLNGAYFSIADGSSVRIGKNSEICTGNVRVVCNGCYKTPHKLVIGDECHIARDTLIRTSDGQTLVDPETNMAINEPQDIIIGNHVWLMSRCMIVKGAVISDNSAVAPYSFVNKRFYDKNVLLAGIPAKVKKENIKWDTRSYNIYMKDFEENNVLQI